jgi:hypothetical protein
LRLWQLQAPLLLASQLLLLLLLLMRLALMQCRQQQRWQAYCCQSWVTLLQEQQGPVCCLLGHQKALQELMQHLLLLYWLLQELPIHFLWAWDWLELLTGLSAPLGASGLQAPVLLLHPAVSIQSQPASGLASAARDYKAVPQLLLPRALALLPRMLQRRAEAAGALLQRAHISNPSCPRTDVS